MLRVLEPVSQECQGLFPRQPLLPGALYTLPRYSASCDVVVSWRTLSCHAVTGKEPRDVWVVSSFLCHRAAVVSVCTDVLVLSRGCTVAVLGEACSGALKALTPVAGSPSRDVTPCPSHSSSRQPGGHHKMTAYQFGGRKTMSYLKGIFSWWCWD